MNININKVDKFPEISRSGRVSEELQMIIDALNESAKSGDKFCIDGVLKGKPYNSLQQRIRAQAKKLGYGIVIRYDAVESKLYFKASSNVKTTVSTNQTPKVSASEMTSVKTKDKTSTTK